MSRTKVYKYGRGVCASCNRLMALRPDGMVGYHAPSVQRYNGRPRFCEGYAQAPKTVVQLPLEV